MTGGPERNRTGRRGLIEIDLTIRKVQRVEKKWRDVEISPICKWAAEFTVWILVDGNK